MYKENDPEFWEYRRLVLKNMRNSVGGFGPPLQGLNEAERTRYDTLAKKFESHGLGPPGHWTHEEIQADIRAGERAGLYMGLFSLVTLGAIYVSQYGWTLRPIVEYFSK